MSWLRKPATAVEGTLEVPSVPDGVLQVCHPEWRGVRSSALAFRDPVVEASDMSMLVPHIDAFITSGVTTVVIQGWPPHAAAFARAISNAGIRVLTVFHSSPAQHGIDIGEAEAVAEMLELQKAGVVTAVATVKAGVAQPFQTLGYQVTHISNRVPDLRAITPATVREGSNVGIFLHPMWRKNVTTQILAAMQLGWHPFVMADPRVPYLSPDDMTICGELPRDQFLSLQAAMDMTFNVTLSECHPMQPMESYVLGVPCLVSRTSELFSDDPELWELTTVALADNPTAIATQAQRLMDNASEAVSRARASLRRLDAVSVELWETFTRS
jgi:hypothetical protein